MLAHRAKIYTDLITYAFVGSRKLHILLRLPSTSTYFYLIFLSKNTAYIIDFKKMKKDKRIFWKKNKRERKNDRPGKVS